MKDIHKTPLEIQDELDKVKLVRGKQSNQIDFMGDLNEGIERHQFDLDVLVTSTLSTHMDTNSSSSQDRRNVLSRSLINDSPFQVNTTISTRSVIKEVPIIERKKLESNIYDAIKTRFCCLESENEKAVSITSKMEQVSHTQSKKRRNEMNKKQIRPLIEGLNEDFKSTFLEELIFDNKISGYILEGNTNTSKSDIIKVAENDKTKCISSVVITELLNQMARYRDKDYNIGSLGDESRRVMLREGSRILVAIRPKMLRAQKDGEIYVLNMDGKFLLYPIDHIY